MLEVCVLVRVTESVISFILWVLKRMGSNEKLSSKNFLIHALLTYVIDT